MVTYTWNAYRRFEFLIELKMKFTELIRESSQAALYLAGAFLAFGFCVFACNRSIASWALASNLILVLIVPLFQLIKRNEISRNTLFRFDRILVLLSGFISVFLTGIALAIADEMFSSSAGPYSILVLAIPVTFVSCFGATEVVFQLEKEKGVEKEKGERKRGRSQ